MIYFLFFIFYYLLFFINILLNYIFVIYFIKQMSFTRGYNINLITSWGNIIKFQYK